MQRRTMLALTGTALSTALAGCGALADSGDDTPTDDSGDGTPTPTDPSDPTATPTDGGTPTDTPGAPSELTNGSFEDDWAAWSVGRDLPTDPNRPGDRAVGSDLGVTTRRSSDGETACRLFIDGSQDDGTVWVQQPVDLSAYDYLAANPEAKKADFLRDVYHDYPAGYESAEAWWNALQPALKDLPGVDPPAERGHLWHFLGGD